MYFNKYFFKFIFPTHVELNSSLKSLTC